MGRTLISTVLFLVALPTAAPAQTTSAELVSNLPNGWIHAPSRAQNDGLWQCAAYGGSWVASNDDGSIALKRFDRKGEKQEPIPPKVSLSKKMIGRRTFRLTSSGWLAGFDGGEFGGGLWWFSRDGSKSIKLLSDNVHAIYQTKAGILILVGLDHMGLNYGNVYKFKDAPDEVDTSLVAKLDGSPEASTVETGGNVIIATPHSVLRVGNDGKVNEIYKSGEYLTYPTSAALGINGIIYVAMRFFVLRLVPQGSGYKAEWLMPEQCRSFNLEKYICTCNGAGNQPH